MTDPHPEQTLQACLTPPGVAALATLAVRGPRAWAVVRALFERPLPETPEPGRFWLGRFGEAARGGRDEVVLAVKRGLPEPWVEVHCHGGREVVALLQEALAAQGVGVCSWAELERRTADGDALTRRALEVLPEALTPRTAAIVLDQHAGALGRELDRVAACLQANDLAGAARLLGEVTKYGTVGRHLTRPWRVVVAGAVNVGKSSLVNALLGYERSVVSATPGTTRDVVTSRLVVDGWPVELADTAGWRTTVEALEQQGQQAAAAAAAQADSCLWLLDGSAAPQWPADSSPAWRHVITKDDLPAAWDVAALPEAVRVSAVTGAGVPELCAALGRWLVPEPPPPGAAVPFTAELSAALEEVRACCTRGDGETARRLMEFHRASGAGAPG
jgi:tRNA modification GTPase